MVTRPSQWVYKCFASLFRLLRASSGLGTFAYPTEIILMIASHLSNVSTMSLALTCRTLYSICFSNHLVLDMKAKEELLLLLEKDVASLNFCHFCVMLHRWHGRWSKSIPPWYTERVPCKKDWDSCKLLPSIWRIPYYHARLVMNRHFYGPTHGPPLHILTQAESFRDLNGVNRRYSHSARIIDNQLFVFSLLSVSHPQGDWVSLRRSINFRGPEVCEHLTLAKLHPRFIPMQVPEVAEEKRGPSPFLLCHQSLGSCTFCMTDCSIRISWQGTRKGYIIEVSV
jgi:hypothetical protein